LPGQQKTGNEKQHARSEHEGVNPQTHRGTSPQDAKHPRREENHKLNPKKKTPPTTS